MLRRNPFVTFCNFLSRNTPGGVDRKVLPTFCGLSIVRVCVSPYEIGRQTPAKLFYKNAKKVLDKQIQQCYHVDTGKRNASHRPPKKNKKISCKGVDKYNRICYHVDVHQRYGHRPTAEYLRRRKLNKPPGSVDHVQTHTLGDWGI